MSLFDSVIGALGAAPGSSNANATATANDPLQAIMGLLNQHGGLSGLLQKLQQGGLGEAVNSWVSSGANQPVTADALGGALGHDNVAGLAQKMGLNPAEMLGPLSQMLPQMVDKLTPHGQVPQGDAGNLGAAGGLGGLGDLAGMLGGLLKR